MMRLFFIGLLITTFSYATGFPEYYYEIDDTKTQKKEFVKILHPLLVQANRMVLEEREYIKNFFSNNASNGFRNLSQEEIATLIKIAKKYRVKKLFAKDEFLRKVDIVPISLGLTQGAIESGWAKSRFVREANNIFGHWTWGEEGLVPNDRDEDKTHKIRIFKSLQNSVNAYVLNLNRNFAYKEFRKLRKEYKKSGKAFTGIEAASTMHNYSELDDEYVDILQGMMEKNKFLAFDQRPASLIATDW